MRKTAFTMPAVLMLLLALMLTGCGKSVKLEYLAEPDNPVIVYYSYQAVSPVYNPGAPVAVIYGDGTRIYKKGAYQFTAGALSGGGVAGVLGELDHLGFFGLKKRYSGQPKPGSATQTMAVYLGAGSDTSLHSVTIEAGAAPANWEEMVAAVTRAQVKGLKDYVPETLVLHANLATETPAGTKVVEWPGNVEDLEKASEADAKGFEIKGGQAAIAWKALREEATGETYWKAGDKVYTFVYAQPVFPGIKPSD